MKKPRLKGSARSRSAPYPLGEIPRDTATLVGKQIVHRLATGHADITGDEFGRMFAKAVEGKHLGKPLGVADIVWSECAWSAKTVHHKNPFKAEALRLISRRNSPDYSLGISDPRKDIEATGRAVLSIWNERVNEALGKYDDLRVVVPVRGMAAREFVLFEDEAERFIPDNYVWRVNKYDNLEGFDRRNDERLFTWQPHGAQFTIHRRVPAAAKRFRIAADVPIVEFEHILEIAGYEDAWIEFQS